MLNTDTYASLLNQGQQLGADFTEIYVERWRRRQLRTVDAKVAEATSGIQLGAGCGSFSERMWSTATRTTFPKRR